MKKLVTLTLALVSFSVSLIAAPSSLDWTAPFPTTQASDLQLMIDKLAVVGRALYVGAHPDDENTAMLAWLANGVPVRTAYLSMTRGDGGQNLIGTEKGELLGLIRTNELLAARRIDGAEQFFTRAIDFGYTKSPDETFAFWGHEEMLADVVQIIRDYKPDVIITRFPVDGRGGHGQHTASAILAEEAFAAAADPKRFPEQLKTTSTWQTKRLLWNRFRRQGEAVPPPSPTLLQVDLGDYSQLLGRSYTEISGLSRSKHKSQGFGASERRGTQRNELELRAGDPMPSGNVFDGVDLGWSRLAGGDGVGRAIETARKSFDPRNPSASVPPLLEARRLLSAIKPKDGWSADIRESKLRDIEETIRAACGLWLEAISADPSVTRGATLKVTASAINRSTIPIRVVRITTGTSVPSTGAELTFNTPLTKELAVVITPEIPDSQPYWLREQPGRGLFRVDDRRLIGSPQNTSSVPVRFDLEIGGEGISYVVPTLYRWVDPVAGERYRPIDILPAVTVQIDQKVRLFTSATPEEVTVTARANRAGISGTVGLQLPAGWRSEPPTEPLTLLAAGATSTTKFKVFPPKTSSAITVTAEAVVDGAHYTKTDVSIDYVHVPRQTLHLPATSRFLRLDLEKRGTRVGYVMGAGDEGPDALQQMGYEVTLLSDEEIEKGDLSRFDTIVAGVRAYNTRDPLKERNARFIDYVEKGGTFVVQYNTTGRTLAENIGPWPFKISGDRVSVEEAPVTFAAPTHSLLSTPNRITQADFDGWVQERGLYFISEWDPRYETVIASHDPGETDKPGGLLFAKHGKGVFIYTGWSFFRELPAGVPGAWRLFANLVSAGHSE